MENCKCYWVINEDGHQVFVDVEPPQVKTIAGSIGFDPSEFEWQIADDVPPCTECEPDKPHS